MIFVVTIRGEKEKKQLELINITTPVLASMTKTGTKTQRFLRHVNDE